jgi:hypothetical protein
VANDSLTLAGPVLATVSPSTPNAHLRFRVDQEVVAAPGGAKEIHEVHGPPQNVIRSGATGTVRAIVEGSTGSVTLTGPAGSTTTLTPGNSATGLVGPQFASSTSPRFRILVEYDA